MTTTAQPVAAGKRRAWKRWLFFLAFVLVAGVGGYVLWQWLRPPPRITEEVGLFVCQEERVRLLTFGADARTLVTLSGDRTIQVWDTTTGRKPRTLNLDTPTLHTAALSPDGKVLATSSPERTDAKTKESKGGLQLWELPSGKLLRTLKAPAQVADEIVFSNDSPLLATFHRAYQKHPAETRVWEVTSGKERAVLRGGSGNLAFLADGKTLAAGGDPWKAWDLSDETTPELSPTGVLQDLRGAPVFFVPDGKHVAQGLGDRHMQIWDLQAGTRLGKFGFEKDEMVNVFVGHGAVVAALKHPKQEHGGLWLWEPVSGRYVASIAVEPPELYERVALSPDRKLLATARGRFIQLWDTSRVLERP
jgi:WD40 repeat protein